MKPLDLHLHNEIIAAVIWWHRPYELKKDRKSVVLPNTNSLKGIEAAAAAGIVAG